MYGYLRHSHLWQPKVLASVSGVPSPPRSPSGLLDLGKVVGQLDSLRARALGGLERRTLVIGQLCRKRGIDHQLGVRVLTVKAGRIIGSAPEVRDDLDP